jgi:hypothetical protein
MIRKCSLMFSLIALTTFLSVQNPHAKPVGNRFTTSVTLGPAVFPMDAGTSNHNTTKIPIRIRNRLSMRITVKTVSYSSTCSVITWLRSNKKCKHAVI